MKLSPTFSRLDVSDHAPRCSPSLRANWLAVMLIGGDSGALAMLKARGRHQALVDEVARREAENAALRTEIAIVEQQVVFRFLRFEVQKQAERVGMGEDNIPLIQF